MIDTAEIQTLVPKARELTAGLSHDILNRRPDANTWSVSECLAHVAATNRQYLPAMTAALDSAPPLRTQAQSVPWLERRFIAYLEPPYKIMKSKAPGIFAPPAGVDVDAAIADWESSHQELLGLAQTAGSRDAASVRIASPAAPWLKVTVLGSFGILAAHSRRHLWQAQRILERLR